MSRPLAVAFLVLLFIAGVAAGVCVDRLFLLRDDGPGHRGPPPPERLLEDLGHELRLDDAQRVAIGKILEDGQQQARALFDGQRPQIEAARAQVRDQILAVLNAEQRKRFLELEQRRPPPPFSDPRGGPPAGPGGPAGPRAPPGPPPFDGPPPLGGPPPFDPPPR